MTPERQSEKGSITRRRTAIFGDIPQGCPPDGRVSVQVVALPAGKTILVSGFYTRQQLFSPDFSETVRADITKRIVAGKIIQTIQNIIDIKKGQR
ncbi:MAG: hypothetical protein BWY24_00348 [Microgenomates group bacterium ADurb.Bin219]|nr:MAG: hypothetical protein BWY24_00348 [Microgenomates group bacterium ADurb.Bin219]